MADKKSGFVDSAIDALNPGNILLKVINTIFFAVLTATPYLIKNLDSVYSDISASGGIVWWAYFKAFTGAVWKGLGIALSTIGDTTLNFSSHVAAGHWGTIGYSVIALLLASMFVYQPLKLLFNILDTEEGAAHSAATVAVISVALVLVILAPLAYLLGGGDTITSGLKDDVEEPDFLNETNITMEDNSSSSTSVTNSLNLLTGEAST